jgi:hypothetical protein
MLYVFKKIIILYGYIYIFFIIIYEITMHNILKQSTLIFNKNNFFLFLYFQFSMLFHFIFYIVTYK